MRTKAEFVKAWRNHVAGMALFGVASERQDGPITRATKILEIPKEVEHLLGRMYDDLFPQGTPVAHPNGQQVKVGQKT